MTACVTSYILHIHFIMGTAQVLHRKTSPALFCLIVRLLTRSHFTLNILVHISQVQSVDQHEMINTATSFANIISPHTMEFTQ